MDYRQYQAPQPAMLSSSRGMARLNGSNRAAWNAMDLEIGAQMPPANARGATTDGGALSARNILLHQKLRERKRYDSADDAMKKAAARRSQTSPPSTQTHVSSTPTPMVSPMSGFSPMGGQSAFLTAMQGDGLKRNVPPNTPLYEARGGPEEGRNALIQRKLQSKVSFDSADYQMSKSTLPAYVNDPLLDLEQAKKASCTSSPINASKLESVTMSPSRASKYGSLLDGKKKPNRRDRLDPQYEINPVLEEKLGSTYGKLSAAHVLIRRKLKERKRFDSADYAMEQQGQPTEVPVDLVTGPLVVAPYGSLRASPIDHQVKHIKLSDNPSKRVASPAKEVVVNAAQAALAARAARYASCHGAEGTKPMTRHLSQAACDRYGLDKSLVLSGAAIGRNVVLQHKLAERKIFDSADHFKKTT